MRVLLLARDADVCHCTSRETAIFSASRAERMDDHVFPSPVMSVALSASDVTTVPPQPRL